MFRKNTLLLIAGATILIGAVLRLYDIEGYVTFLGDQGRDASIVRNIATFKHFPSIGAPSSVGQVYLGPFYYYLLVPFLVLFSYNPAGLAYGVSIISIAGLMTMFILLRKILGLNKSLFILLCITFSYPLVHLSRFSWNPNLLPLFSFLTMYFFYMLIKKKSTLWSVLFGSFFAFTIQLHYLALLLSFPIGLISIYTSFKDKAVFIPPRKILYSILSFLFFSLPLIIFDIRHDFLNTKNFIALFTDGEIGSSEPYFLRLTETIHSFFLHTFQLEIPLFASISLFILLLVLSIRHFLLHRSTFFLIHSMVFFLFIFGFAILSGSRHLHYYGPAFLSFFIICIILICSATHRVKTYSVLGVFFLLVLYSGFSSYEFIHQKPQYQIKSAKEFAQSFEGFITNEPIQLVNIPFTESDGHIRYFLELERYDVMRHDSAEQAEELFVLCYVENCKPLDDPQWQIAVFYNKELETSWKHRSATIYKIIHGQDEVNE